MNFSWNDGLFILVCLVGQLFCTVADRGLGQFQQTLSWTPLLVFFLAELLGKVGVQGIVANWVGSDFSLLRIFAVVLAIPLINAYFRGLVEFHLITWIGVLIFLTGATVLTLFGRS